MLVALRVESVYYDCLGDDEVAMLKQAVVRVIAQHTVRTLVTWGYTVPDYV